MKTNDFIYFLFGTLILNFLYFNEKVFTRINDILLSNPIFGGVWIGFGLIFLCLSYLSFKTIQWEISPKYIQKVSILKCIYYWLLTVLAIVSSIGSFMVIKLDYKLSFDQIWHLNKLLTTPVFTNLLLAVASVSLLKSIFKWTSPKNAAIDYTKLHIAINEVRKYFLDESVSLWEKYSLPQKKQVIENISELLEIANSELKNNLILDKNNKQEKKGHEIQKNIQSLLNFINEIHERETFGDFICFLKNKLGGAFDSNVLKIKKEFYIYF